MIGHSGLLGVFSLKNILAAMAGIGQPQIDSIQNRGMVISKENSFFYSVTF